MPMQMGIQGLLYWALTLPIQCHVCLSFTAHLEGSHAPGRPVSAWSPRPSFTENSCVHCLLECLVSPLSPVKAKFLFFVSPDMCSGAHWITAATISKNYDVSGPYAASLSLLLGIFPTQELNQDLLHCRWILYQLSYQESPWYFQPSPKLYIWWIRKWRLTEITSVYPSR